MRKPNNTAQWISTNGLSGLTLSLFALARPSMTELRIVSVMNTFPPDRRDHRPEAVSRRRLLRVAGGPSGRASSARARNLSPIPRAARVRARNASTAAAPPPRPVATPAPLPSAASAVLLCRDAWGARPTRPSHHHPHYASPRNRAAHSTVWAWVPGEPRSGGRCFAERGRCWSAIG
jgi:hypothetical protein